VAEHKEKEEFYVYMARNKDSKSVKVDWYIDIGASRYFTNSIVCYSDFVEYKSQYDLVLLSCREAY
jgi:hypothetical protein